MGALGDGEKLTKLAGEAMQAKACEQKIQERNAGYVPISAFQ